MKFNICRGKFSKLAEKPTQSLLAGLGWEHFRASFYTQTVFQQSLQEEKRINWTVSEYQK